MAFTTYDELKTELAEWSARGDLATKMDSFILMAETLFRRVPDPDGMGGIRANKQRLAGTGTASSDTLALPSDYLALVRFRWTGNFAGRVEYISPTDLADKWKSGTDVPKFFTISDVIEFDVALDSDLAYELTYWPQATALSASNTTNWILQDYPELYLAGCMFYLSRYLKDEKEAMAWSMQYTSDAWQANQSYTEGQYDQSQLQTRARHVA